MNYLTLENISKSYGEKILFERISYTIGKGQKIGLIAQNGAGKTSLLRVIAGEEKPDGDTSKVFVSKDIKIAYLKQEPIFKYSDTVLEAAYDSDNQKIIAIKEYEKSIIEGDERKIQECVTKIEDFKAWEIEHRIKEVLGKFKILDLTQEISTLSGGQKKRLALAKIIIDEPDFFILDEPTNHLDIEMIEWLEVFLSKKNTTLFMVTHDRYFLERICNEILELDNANLYTYRGNYSDYLEKKTHRKINESINLEKTRKLYKRELEWVRRQPKARTTKAKSRVDKFLIIEEDSNKDIKEQKVNIQIDSKRIGGKILEVHSLHKSFGEFKIIEGFNYKFKKGERLGIVGPNGIGKTSFIKLLTKELEPDSGKVIIGDTIVFGHYSQSHLSLKKDKRVIEFIRDIAEYIPLKKGLKLTAESLLEKFLFSRAQQQVYISQLSGGEKRRLQLLAVLMKNPNFLILDEPTNDLDILTLNVFEDYLEGFPGCIIIVSHDRYFMDKLVDHIFVMKGKGEIKDFNGSYSDFKRIENQRSISTKPKLIKDDESKKIIQLRKLSYMEKKEFTLLNKEIEDLEHEKLSIEIIFQDPSLSGEKISGLLKKLSNISKLIDEKENRWLELSEYI